MTSPLPTTRAIEDQLFAALAVARVVLLLNALGLNIYRRGNFDHLTAAIVCVALMVAWTCVANVAYARPRLRVAPLFVLDLAIAVSLMLVTPLLKGEDFRATMPGFWVAGALLAWSIRFGPAGGFAAGALLAVADITPRIELRQSDYGNAFLLVLSGTVIGYLCASLRTLSAEREAAQRTALIAAERARLARAVHDGVLQVLALVQRRGRELGGELAELGTLAGEQEQRLRRLIRAQDSVSLDTEKVDLTTALGPLEELSGVTVAAPSHRVELPAPAARELVAAVRACLDNVRVHVGPDAPAWVLVQDHDERVEVSVRDDGPGIASGRLEVAAAEGRLGVMESIRGRIRDLGGIAELVTGDFGTEWTFTIPRDAALGGRHG
ncbi:MacS family sensor histidine kinase [Aeromicrobium sp.]|uniref:MacS family sensor histidine kinase n=1 Tax=Aeromicrobium sp. TaxID=1871063 RepID=UPI0028A9B895|nr:DUF5931 domain-containing protein [Aeromicrobium sp.]